MSDLAPMEMSIRCGHCANGCTMKAVYDGNIWTLYGNRCDEGLLHAKREVYVRLERKKKREELEKRGQ